MTGNAKNADTRNRKSFASKDDPEQSKRFIETAKEVEAEDEQALDRAFKKISPRPKEQQDGS